MAKDSAPPAAPSDGGSELLDIISSYGPTVSSLRDDISSLWIDVLRKLSGAQQLATHPELRAMYELIQRQQQTVLDDTEAAFKTAQQVIGMFKEADYQSWLRRIQTGLRNVNPETIAREDVLAAAKKADQVIERAPLTAGGVVAAAHVPLYDLPGLHRDVLAAFLGRDPAGKRITAGARKILRAAAEEAVPGVGVAIAIAEQMEPLIERELRELPQQVQYQDSILHFRDALQHLVTLSQNAKASAESCRVQMDELNAAFHGSAVWLTSLLESGVPPSGT